MGPSSAPGSRIQYAQPYWGCPITIGRSSLSQTGCDPLQRPCQCAQAQQLPLLILGETSVQLDDCWQSLDAN